MIPRITPLRLRVAFRLSFEIGAGDVVEQKTGIRCPRHDLCPRDTIILLLAMLRGMDLTIRVAMVCCFADTARTRKK
jgi:hypothetical protein